MLYCILAYKFVLIMARIWDYPSSRPNKYECIFRIIETNKKYKENTHTQDTKNIKYREHNR